jgi:TolA-binding protein
MQANVAPLPVSHRLWAWFEANRKPALGGAAIVVLAGLIIGFLAWKHGATDQQAGEELSAIAASQMGAVMPRPNPAQDLLAIAAKYPNTPAGAQALLFAGSTYFTDGKYAEAQAEFERFAREYRDSEFAGDALLGIAASLAAQGKTDQAISAYKNLIERHGNDIAVPQAKFALANLYAAQNKPELARDLYEELTRNPYSSIANDAAMRLEELSSKHPNLGAAMPVPATNTTFRIEKK